jgi:hypothetical protein
LVPRVHARITDSRSESGRWTVMAIRA